MCIPAARRRTCEGVSSNTESPCNQKGNMKRYCKNVNIRDIEFLKKCVGLWVEKKRDRGYAHKLLSQYTGIPRREIEEAIACEDYWFVPKAIELIADDVQRRIIARDLNLPPIRYKDKYDDCSGKWRTLGIQHPIHQIFDYVAVEACRELFEAKIGPYQMASLPGRGQEKGVKKIYQWMRTDKSHTKYFVKADIRKCYPSIAHENIKGLYARDVKNEELLWLLYELIDSFQDGLIIGSYLSLYSCSYYLSKAYHYASEQLYKNRKKRDGSVTRIRLIYHLQFYVDDIVFFGSSRKDLQKAMEMEEKFLLENMGLTLKPGWRVEMADYVDPNGKRHGRFVDIMGYRIYRDHITIRRRTFLKIRRTFVRAKIILKRRALPIDMARRIGSYGGKLDHSDSASFCRKYKAGAARFKASKTISAHDKNIASKKKARRLVYENRKCKMSGRTGENQVHPDSRWTCGSMDEEKYTESDIPF